MEGASFCLLLFFLLRKIVTFKKPKMNKKDHKLVRETLTGFDTDLVLWLRVWPCSARPSRTAGTTRPRLACPPAASRSASAKCSAKPPSSAPRRLSPWSPWWPTWTSRPRSPAYDRPIRRHRTSSQKHGSTRGDERPTLVGWRSGFSFFFFLYIFLSFLGGVCSFKCGPLLTFRKHPAPTSPHQFISTSFWYVCLRILAF